MTPKRSQPHLINQEKDWFMEISLGYHFVEVPNEVEGIKKSFSYIYTMKLEDTKVLKAWLNIEKLTSEKLKVFDSVGLLNLLNMLDFFIYENVIKFIYKCYQNNIL